MDRAGSTAAGCARSGDWYRGHTEPLPPALIGEAPTAVRGVESNNLGERATMLEWLVGLFPALPLAAALWIGDRHSGRMGRWRSARAAQQPNRIERLRRFR
jgi:hypothetical protein